MIKFSNDELKIICAALNAYYGRQYGAANFFFGRLSVAGQSALEDELKSIEDLHGRIWDYLSEEANDDAE